MSPWTAFLLGLLGSLHCAGMCGPLALAVSGSARVPADNHKRVHAGLFSAASTSWLASRLAYNLGRIATYCAIGLLFGILGRTVFLAGFQRWFSLGVGLILLLALIPLRKPRLWLFIPALVQLLKQRMSFLLGRRTLGSIATLGALNGLLPCGLVYVAAAAAATTGSAVRGLSYMAAFGAGTVPMLLGIGIIGKLVPISFRLKLQRATPAAVFIIGLLLIVRGLSLGIPYVSPDLSAPGACCHK